MKKFFVAAALALLFCANNALAGNNTSNEVSNVNSEAPAVPEGKQVGPCHVENDFFSFDVPKGWYLDRESVSSSIVSYRLCPIVDPKGSSNFGWNIDFWGFKNSSFTAKGVIDDFLGVFSNGQVESDVKVGNNVFKSVHVDGNGGTRTLAIDYNGEGAVKLDIHSNSVKDKGVKAVLKSLVIK